MSCISIFDDMYSVELDMCIISYCGPGTALAPFRVRLQQPPARTSNWGIHHQNVSVKPNASVVNDTCIRRTQWADVIHDTCQIMKSLPPILPHWTSSEAWCGVSMFWAQLQLSMSVTTRQILPPSTTNCHIPACSELKCSYEFCTEDVVRRRQYMAVYCCRRLYVVGMRL